VFDVQLVDFDVEMRIAFLPANRLSMFAPFVKRLDVATDLETAVMRRDEPVFVSTDLDWKPFETLRAFEVRASEVRASEVRAFEVRASEVRASEVRALFHSKLNCQF